MYTFSNTDTKKLKSCHEDLFTIAVTAIAFSHVQFGIIEGARPIEKQREYYKNGRSKLNPDDSDDLKNAKHIIVPRLGREKSHAFDLVARENGNVVWKKEPYIYLGGLITGISNMLHNSGKIEHTIRWGGNWDGDGVVVTDQDFDDLVHFEIESN